jgi:hypothetical protein
MFAKCGGAKRNRLRATLFYGVTLSQCTAKLRGFSVTIRNVLIKTLSGRTTAESTTVTITWKISLSVRILESKNSWLSGRTSSIQNGGGAQDVS